MLYEYNKNPLGHYERLTIRDDEENPNSLIFYFGRINGCRSDHFCIPLSDIPEIINILQERLNEN